MLGRIHNTLTANEVRNDRDTVLSIVTPPLMRQSIKPSVLDRTSRNMSRKKLTCFVSTVVVIGLIFLLILIPILGLEKSDSSQYDSKKD